MGKQNKKRKIQTTKREEKTESHHSQLAGAGHHRQPTTPTPVSKELNKEQEYQQKYQKYSQAFLTSYRHCDNQQQWRQTRRQVFYEKIELIRETLSFERFKNNQAQQDYQLFLYNFFLEFTSFQGEPQKRDCGAVLDWLKEQRLEEILAQKAEPTMVKFLLSEGHQQGVSWVLAQYDQQEILQIFADQSLLKDIQLTGDTEMVKLIQAKVREIITEIAVERREIEVGGKKLIARENLAESIDQQLLPSSHPSC